MARISTRYVSWKILFDGVEIPWLGFTVSVGVDLTGSANITIEPDVMIDHIRPDSIVEIFFYDDLEEEGSDEDKYKFFWKGSVRGYMHSKSGSGRSAAVVASGDLEMFGRSKLYAHGVGSIPTTPIVSGSMLGYTGVLQGSQLFNYAILGRAFNPANTDVPLGPKQTVEQLVPPPSYSDRVVGLLAYLSSYNALARLQAMRSRLFSRMATMTDRSMDRLIPRSMISDYVEKMIGGALSDKTTALDLIALVNQIAYHHFASVGGPAVPAADKGMIGALYLPGSSVEDNLYAIGRPYLRNDYIFMPEMYYAVPPACNFIFPEHYQNLDLTRSFDQEATRAIVYDHFINGSLVVTAPDDILRYAEKTLTPAEFWSLSKNGLEADGVTNSPYQSLSLDKSNKPVSLFGAVSDLEIEKGMVVTEELPPFEYFAAVSNIFDADKATQDVIGAVTKPLEKMPSNDKSKLGKESSYIYLMKALADHTLNMAKFRRSVSITLTGHRWLVPGFPCVLFDKTASYISYVRATTLSVTSEGAETTSVMLDYTRPITQSSADQRISGFDAGKKEGELSDIKAMAYKVANEVLRNKVSFESAIKTILAGLDKQDEIFDQQQAAYIDKTAAAMVSTMFNQMATNLSKDRARQTECGTNAGELEKLTRDLAVLKNAAAGSFASYKGVSRTSLARVVAIMEAYQAGDSTRVSTAIDTLDASLVPDVGADSDAMKSALDTFAIGHPFPEDFFAPPVFANFDFLSPKIIEPMYQDLIGSRPVFSELVKEGASRSVDAGTTAGVAALRLDSYSKYKGIINALRKIFPIDATQAGSEWGDASDRTDDEESVRAWADKRFLRRTGLLSLRQYAAKHGLDLSTVDSNGPTIQPFTVLVPKRVYPVGKFSWDDTQYSKIVDEFKIAPRGFKIRNPADGSVITIEPESDRTDAEIKRLRESVSEPMLTTKERQRFWIEYAKRHTGSKAFAD